MAWPFASSTGSPSAGKVRPFPPAPLYSRMQTMGSSACIEYRRQLSDPAPLLLPPSNHSSIPSFPILHHRPSPLPLTPSPSCPQPTSTTCRRWTVPWAAWRSPPCLPAAVPSTTASDSPPTRTRTCRTTRPHRRGPKEGQEETEGRGGRRIHHRRRGHGHRTGQERRGQGRKGEGRRHRRPRLTREARVVCKGC